MTALAAWIAAAAAAVGAVVAVLTYRKVQSGQHAVLWEGPVERGGGLCIRNLGPADAKNVKISISEHAGRMSWPSGDEHEVVHAGAYVQLGSFAARSSYMAPGSVTVTWESGGRPGTWESPIVF